MMGRLNRDQGQFFYSFHLEEAVPGDHAVRDIAAVLDLSWVYSELEPFYPKIGRPSIDRCSSSGCLSSAMCLRSGRSEHYAAMYR